MHSNQSDTDSESIECCNSGCNNCVLDVRQKQLEKFANRHQVASDRVNVLSDQYATFQVISIVKCSSIVQRYRFKFVYECDAKASQVYELVVPTTFHLFLRAPVTADSVVSDKYDKDTVEHYISRPYTPVCFNSNDLTFDIIVKYESNGLMSKYLSDLQANDITEWKGCYGSFVWTPNHTKYLVCICQGVAIAPICSLVSSILSDENEDTVVILLACFRDIQHILLRDELCDFRQYWNFQSTVYLSNENTCKLCDSQKTANCACLKSKRRFNETICNFRLDYHELANVYRKLNTNSVHTVFCGTKTLENVIENCFDEIGDDKISEHYFKFE